MIIFIVLYCIVCVLNFRFLWHKDLFDVIPLKLKVEFVLTNAMLSLFWLPISVYMLIIIFFEMAYSFFIKGKHPLDREKLHSKVNKTCELVDNIECEIQKLRKLKNER